MVEQLTLNQRVVGSSPTRFTIIFRQIQRFRKTSVIPAVAGTVAGGCRFCDLSPSADLAESHRALCPLLRCPLFFLKIEFIWNV